VDLVQLVLVCSAEEQVGVWAQGSTLRCRRSGRKGLAKLGWDWIREALEACRVIDELWCGDWYYHSVSMYDAKALPKKR